MDGEFETYDPGKFFEVFVRRAYREFLQAPTDAYRIKMAVSNADILAERVWNHWRESDRRKIGGADSPRKYREYLVQNECPDFQLVWDIHDGHKHVRLSRGRRSVSTAAQTGTRRRGGAFAPDAFDNRAFQVGAIEAVVILDDGTERRLLDVLRNAMEMWERLLPTLV